MTRSASLPIAGLMIAGLPIALALAGAAVAQPPPAPPQPNVAATFGNTVVSTYPDGRTQKIWLQSDGGWTGISRKGTALAGHWTLKGEKVCLRQSKPPTLPISFCQALPSDMTREVDTHDILGTPIRLRLVKGIIDGPPAPPAVARGSGGR